MSLYRCSVGILFSAFFMLSCKEKTLFTELKIFLLSPLLRNLILNFLKYKGLMLWEIETKIHQLFNKWCQKADFWSECT